MGKRYHVRKIDKSQQQDKHLPPSMGDRVSYVSATDGGRVTGSFIGFKQGRGGKTLATLRRDKDGKIVSVDPVKKMFQVEPKPVYATLNAAPPSPW